jgi:hypothetical protein
MMRNSLRLFGIVTVLVLANISAVLAFDVALGIVNVYDGAKKVVADKVELTKEGEATKVLKPILTSYFANLETSSRYTLKVTLADKRHMSMSGIVGPKNGAIDIKVTFGPFAHQTRVEKLGSSLFCVGKLQLINKVTNQPINKRVLLSCKQTDGASTFTCFTQDDGSAEIVFTKPSAWQITVAPLEKTVKSEFITFKIEKIETEKSLRLPVWNVAGSSEATGGM